MMAVFEGAVGSGYPGDAITKKWLQENTHEFWGPPSCTRFSWRPVKDIVAEQVGSLPCPALPCPALRIDDEMASSARALCIMCARG
jgi:hypothetical protein